MRARPLISANALRAAKTAPASAAAAAAGPLRVASMSSETTDPFDPRPLRIAAVIAVLFIIAPGSFYGAALLWVLGGGGASMVALVPASTHAMLQLAGGFMTLIWAFLAFGVPHLLGLDAKRARRVLIPIFGVAAALALDVTAIVTASPALAVAARVAGVASAGAGLALFALARMAVPTKAQLWRTMPLPFLMVALALYPCAWLAHACEPLAVLPAGVASDALLFLVVVPVVLSMGWKMFSAMLQLDSGHGPRLAAAITTWIVGGALVVVARGIPEVAPFAAPFLLGGALLWFASLHGLRRRRGGLALIATAGPELRIHVVVGAASLILSPILWALATVFDNAAFYDLARHVLALGFVLAVTMGVTLRALPRFCRGAPSSRGLALVTLAMLVVGLMLRAARVLDHDVAGAFVRASAGITLVAALLWGAHLLRGLREVDAARRA